MKDEGHYGGGRTVREEQRRRVIQSEDRSVEVENLHFRFFPSSLPLRAHQFRERERLFVW
jgi:hypothetical protein